MTECITANSRNCSGHLRSSCPWEITLCGPARRRTEAWHSHAVEYYSPGNQRTHLTRRRRISGTFCWWSKRSQTPKNAHRMVPFVWNSRTGQVRHAAETRAVPAYTGGGRERTPRGDGTQWSHSCMRLSKFIPLCFESMRSVICELYQDEKREQK